MRAQADAAPAKKSQPGRFKVIASVVLAMKRFQAALNPTYEYKKTPADPQAHLAVSRARGWVVPRCRLQEGGGRREPAGFSVCCG